jgi:hypothetical protein
MAMSDPRYPIIVNILDEIRKAAPELPEFSYFRSKKKEDIEASRSQAYIHLLLQVRFGIEDFRKRDEFICDGIYDGGVDAIYIDKEDRIIYFVQSKFRHTPENFISTKLGVGDLIKMEIRRIASGEATDSNGNKLNDKVRKLQALITDANREAYHQYRVLFLANLDDKMNEEQVHLFTDQFQYEIYDYERSYNDLVRPVCTGTNYYSGVANRPISFIMDLDLQDKKEPYSHQIANTSYGMCEIYSVYAPTKEIGRMIAKYKNAILRYNPRNFLGLGNKENLVNQNIRSSIVDVSSNNFALLNNGITILADDAKVQTDTGTYNLGLLSLTNPQIVNGGQTAYTLGVLFETEYPKKPEIFEKKEVLLRIVKLSHSTSTAMDVGKHLLLVRALSESTNKQTAIKEADRRSNEPIFQQVQDIIFTKFGYLLVVKQGEFYNGIKKGYVKKDILLDREVALRSLIAFRFLNPVLARNGGANKLFSETDFFNFLKHKDDQELQDIAAQIFFAHMIYTKLPKARKNSKTLITQYGYSLIYGRYAVITAISQSMNKAKKSHLKNQTISDLEKDRALEVKRVLNKWKNFEEFVITSRKNSNSEYIRDGVLDYDNYYKGKTLYDDIKIFKW